MNVNVLPQSFAYLLNYFEVAALYDFKSIS